MKKEIIKEVFKYIIIFFAMLFIFCLAMIITYALPNNRIRAHIEESKDMLGNLNGNPLFQEDIKGAQLDVFTDLLIMNTAMNKGKAENESILVRTFENSNYSAESGNQHEALLKTIEDDELYNNQGYSRYWHGIQTIIRPLLLVFNYDEIRYLFYILMFLLLGIAVIVVSKTLNIMHGMSLVFAMTAVGFFIVPSSIQYIGVFAITLINIILVNILYMIKKENLYPYLFFIMGGLTTFFDLLTAPLLTLGMPLIYVVLLKNKENCNVKESIIDIIKLSILWCVSYATIFFAKWVIASIILHENLITVAIKQLLFRANGNEAYPATRLGAIKENIGFLFNNVLIAISILIMIVWVILMIKNRKKISDLKILIPILLVTVYPYVWYMAFAGHSTIHAWFTYRVQAIAVLGILTSMVECIDKKKIKNN